MLQQSAQYEFAYFRTNVCLAPDEHPRPIPNLRLVTPFSSLGRMVVINYQLVYKYYGEFRSIIMWFICDKI